MIRLAKYLAVTVISALAISQSPSWAADWPQYRGPAGDGISAESIKLPWPAGGPKILWTAPATNGFSSFSISGGEAFTQVGRETNGSQREFCIALDATNGKELWAVDVGQSDYGNAGGNSGTKNNKGGDGPRSTPVVSDGKVYVLASDLVLYCLDPKSGKQAWSKDLVKDFGGKNITWKSAASPVIEGDLLYVAAGGAGESFIAFNKKTGEVAWKSGSEKITHATPVVGTILGVRQVIFFVQSGLVSVAPDTGKELWRYPFKYSTSTAASPVICGDIVYAAGYNVGSGACKITKTANGLAAAEMWRLTGNKPVCNHWSTPVYKDGYLYGMFSFKEYGSGPLKCVEVATGKVMWEKPGFGAGNVILAGGDKLIALADDGQVVVAQALPTGYSEISRAQAVTGKCWSTPALSDGNLYIRSTREGACLDLGGK